jgi:drug/metabolite transporter (DMT)-like permease
MDSARFGPGIGLIVGSVFLMSFGDALIKLASASFTVWQIFVLRSLIVLPLLLLAMRLTAPGEPVMPRVPGWVALRSGLLTLMWIASLHPRRSSARFDYSYVVFAVLWSALLLGELPDAATVLGVALIASGGALVAGVRFRTRLARHRRLARP